jgi:hypothetical protein
MAPEHGPLTSVVWAAGEHFGSLFSGLATDPISDPLPLLITAAFWSRCQR